MKCTICDGLGFLYERDAAGDRYEVDCQTCGATGRVIDPDALERIATALERIANRLDSIARLDNGVPVENVTGGYR